MNKDGSSKRLSALGGLRKSDTFLYIVQRKEAADLNTKCIFASITQLVKNIRETTGIKTKENAASAARAMYESDKSTIKADNSTTFLENETTEYKPLFSLFLVLVNRADSPEAWSSGYSLPRNI
ncbi:hypothetical protein O997_04240 [Anaplasma phagocytophilum str. MRK]|nr:hypothetical protein O997_04240 [Anaplasma phagocytophilum str. MRK]